MPVPVRAQLNTSSVNGMCPYWYWTKVQNCQCRYGHHWMLVPVMDCVYPGTDQSAKMPVPVWATFWNTRIGNGRCPYWYWAKVYCQYWYRHHFWMLICAFWFQHIWHHWRYMLLLQCISFHSFTLEPLFSLFHHIWFLTLLLWWIYFHSFTLQISLFHHSVPVMECAHTGTEPKCKNASTGMDGHNWMPVPVMECAHTGNEPKCKIAITGTDIWISVPVMNCAHTGTEPKFQTASTFTSSILEYQYR